MPVVYMTCIDIANGNISKSSRIKIRVSKDLITFYFNTTMVKHLVTSYCMPQSYTQFGVKIPTDYKNILAKWQETIEIFCNRCRIPGKRRQFSWQLSYKSRLSPEIRYKRHMGLALCSNNSKLVCLFY